jgi:CubicO group peptidase (beta-lactamase class C family)
MNRLSFHVLRLVLLLNLVVVISTGRAANPLPRSEPEAQGVSSAALLDLVRVLDADIEGMHSLMIVRHGHVIAEGWWQPYAAARQHVLYSLSKSFTSTAVGFAVAEGKLSVDDVVLEYFPEEAPDEISANLKAMRVRDLLTMTTGHQVEPPTGPDAVSAESFLAQPVPHLPGTHFKYNTAATFMLSAIVQKVAGNTVLEYLRPRLFEPLGIEPPVWDTNYQGISLGGYGLRVRTEDIARFGQLYLQRGAWRGRQLLPAEWIDIATASQVSNGSDPASDWNQGYGFQFWRCRHNAYRGDGAFGQYCIVLPDQDAVVAITSGVRDMQAVLDVIWDRLLPACQMGAIPADEVSHEQLQQRLACLVVTPAKGSDSSPSTPAVLNRRYRFPANDQRVESLALNSTDGGRSLTLTVEQDGKVAKLPAGYRHWRTGRTPLPAGRLSRVADEPVAGTFAWSAENTAVVKVCAYETPFHIT